jgi:hypothetical protein
MPTRKQYYKMIWAYKKRRLAMRVKYGYTTPKYKQAVKRINKKLMSWRQEIKRIDKRNLAIEALIKSVNQYFDVDIRVKSKKREILLARYVYYKFGLEEKIYRSKGTHLSKALNRKMPREASMRRLTFTRTFKTTPSNQQAYHNFKSYMEQI